MRGTPPQGAVGDVRDLPFRDASFDAIYSMGTIEHFDETERAVAEIARVLKPGGRAIVGVPNRHDPFLRPLFATALQAVGLYGYGYEKSYSRRALRRMLEGAGLTWSPKRRSCSSRAGCGCCDLACHAWCRPLDVVTRHPGSAVRLPRPPRAGRAPARATCSRPSSPSAAPDSPVVQDDAEEKVVEVDPAQMNAQDLAGTARRSSRATGACSRARLLQYGQMGARFAKWHAVIAVGDGLPSRSCLEANAHALARYAALCQEAGLVPIVEPEVLMTGAHPQERCRAVTEEVVRRVFDQIAIQQVMLEAMILKPTWCCRD